MPPPRSAARADATRTRRLRAARLGAQRLAGPPATSVAEAVASVLAVQGQDPRGFRLAVRARSTGLDAADVVAALTHERSVVVSTLLRGTLHLVTAQDYWWLADLTAPLLTTVSRTRLRQLEVSAPQQVRGVDVIAAAVATGPRSRAELRSALEVAAVPTDGQAFIHLVFAATLAGAIVRGPVRGGEHLFVAVEDWLGPRPPALDGEEALARLAHRYLRGHGPAQPADLAAWAGIGLRAARRGFDAISKQTEPFDHHDQSGPLALLGNADPPPLPPPRLLGMFDPVLHGWASRALVVGEHGPIVTRNGMFRATAMVGGRVVGTWTMPGATVVVEAFEPVSASALRALTRDGAAVAAFLAAERASGLGA